MYSVFRVWVPNITYTLTPKVSVPILVPNSVCVYIRHVYTRTLPTYQTTYQTTYLMTHIQTPPNMEMFDAYCKMRREVHEFTERKLDEFASLFLSTSHQSFLTVKRNPSSFSEQSVESKTTQNNQKIVIPKPIPNQNSLKKRLEEKEKKSSTAKVTSIHQPSSSTNKRKAESPQRKLIRIPPNPAKVASLSKKIRTESPPQQSKPTSPEPAQNTHSEHSQHITKSTPPHTKSSQSSEQEENSATKRKNPFRELEERCLKEQEMFEDNENSEEEEEDKEESDEEEEKDKEEEEEGEMKEDDIEEESEMGSDVEVID